MITKLTDISGYVDQHIQYLPFGELFISQRNSTFDSRYKFTAKELDNETNYTYFGARYLDSDISIWLSVDPLSDEYPSISAYVYVANNPINYVDPNGMEIDPTPLKTDDPDTYNRLINDWQSQTGYTFTEDSKGRLIIDKSAGISRDENGEKIGSRRSRNLIKNAINSEKIFTLNMAPENSITSSADITTGNIYIHAPSISELMNNSHGIDPQVVGFGMTGFHELAHVFLGIRDGRDSRTDKSYKRGGPCVRYVNQIEKQLYGRDVTRTAYSIKIGSSLYVPYDKNTRNQMRNGNVPVSGKFTFLRIETANPRNL